MKIRARSLLRWWKYFFLMIFIVYTIGYTFVFIRIYTSTSQENKIAADAVLVLGTSSYKDGQINPCLVSRVEGGIQLYNEGLVDTLIFSGGTEKQPPFANEAEIMEKIARDRFILPENIILETKATSTYENLLYSKSILKVRDLDSVMIVTEGFHMPRAVATAEKVFGEEITFGYMPVPETECWKEGTFWSHRLFREPVAYLFYAATGKL